MAAECSTEPLKTALEKSTVDTWEILWQYYEADKQRRGERRDERNSFQRVLGSKVNASNICGEFESIS